MFRKLGPLLGIRISDFAGQTSFCKRPSGFFYEIQNPFRYSSERKWLRPASPMQGPQFAVSHGVFCSLGISTCTFAQVLVSTSLATTQILFGGCLTLHCAECKIGKTCGWHMFMNSSGCQQYHSAQVEPCNLGSMLTWKGKITYHFETTWENM